MKIIWISIRGGGLVITVVEFGEARCQRESAYTYYMLPVLFVGKAQHIHVWF